MHISRFAIAAAVASLSALLAIDVLIAQPAPATVPVAATQPRIPVAPAFEATVIADHLTAPWAIAFLPDGRALVTERSGKVRIVGTDLKMLAEPALQLPVKAWLKMGLLGCAVDPDFAHNGHVYLAQNYGDDRQDRGGVSRMRVVRYTMRDDKLVEPRTLIDEIPAFWNHTGGRLKFGPDGKLYITTGDADDPPLAQNKRALAGKILRINADGSIPDDNPFAGQADAFNAIWTYGHRNPQGLAWQPGTDRLYAPEHGPNGGDEINRIVKGTNYGWPEISHDRTAPGMASPLAEFTPSVAPAGATFYDGAMFPSLKGDLLVGCLRGEALLRVRLDESGERITSVERLLYHRFGRLRDVVVAPDGAIWITTSEIDPPDGRGSDSDNPDGFDKVIRLTPGTGAADASALPDPTTQPRPVGAVAIYDANCRACHGSGNGPSLNTSLFDGQWTLGVNNDSDLRRIIVEGVQNRGMPAYKDLLTREEITELVRFIRLREETHRNG